MRGGVIIIYFVRAFLSMYESHVYEGCRVILVSRGGGGRGWKEVKKNAGSFAVWLALSRAVWVGGDRSELSIYDFQKS